MEAIPIRVYLTGGLRIECVDTVVDHRTFDVPHAQLALAYLVCERGRPVARAEIANLLGQSAEATVNADDLLARLDHALRAHVPASELVSALATLVMKCVETKADARPQRMTDVLLALDSGEPNPPRLRGLRDIMGLRPRKG